MRGIFISYRRDDTAGYAGRLYDALAAHFGRSQVFIDIDSIRAGEDFVEVIDQWMAGCSVVIVLIGKGWLNSSDAHGRRLDNPQDFVRLEVASALRHKIPVIPVLVGGAKMPRPEDLPAPLVPLAHLNAIEIFDQLFRDSVRHLIDALRPYAYPKGLFSRWSRPVSRRFTPWIVTITLVGALGIAAILLSPPWSTRRSPDQEDTHNAAPPPSETLAGPEESDSSLPPVKVTKAPDVAELPPVVEASRNVMLPGSSSQVTGPVKPRILWRAKVTVGDAWHVVGIAADGTVYLYDQEHEEVDAIRDGKEQWAHSTPTPTGFDAEGRLWLGDYSFNSRGEGGRVTKRSLVPNHTTLRMNSSPYSYGDEPNCSEGKVYPNHYRRTWSVDLDGNCGVQDPTFDSPTGNLYASSDAGTLYAISRDGRVLWSVKGACKDSRVNVYPTPNGDVIVSCSKQPLYALRDGKTLWTVSDGTSGGSEVISDKSGNIYFGASAQGHSPSSDLAAFDKSGKPKWRVSSGTFEMPEPVGFDAQGRMYVIVGERIMSLSQ
jgi:hypothetical protein